MSKSLLLQEEKLTTWNGDLHLLTMGNQDAQPILFLHGLTESAKAFLPVMQQLSEEYFVVAADLRGRGESFKPKTGYRMDHYIEDLLAIVNGYLSPKFKPILVAHSLSARFSTKFAAHYPSLLEKLVLVDPPISGPGRRGFPVPISRFLGPKQALDEKDEVRFEQYYDASKIDLNLKKYEMKNCTVEAIEESYHSIVNEPFHVYFAMLTVPTMLLAANSPFITDEEFMDLSNLNTSVTMKRQRAVGHEMFKENPNLFSNEILGFLRGEKIGY